MKKLISIFLSLTISFDPLAGIFCFASPIQSESELHSESSTTELSENNLMPIDFEHVMLIVSEKKESFLTNAAVICYSILSNSKNNVVKLDVKLLRELYKFFCRVIDDYDYACIITMQLILLKRFVEHDNKNPIAFLSVDNIGTVIVISHFVAKKFLKDKLVKAEYYTKKFNIDVDIFLDSEFNFLKNIKYDLFIEQEEFYYFLRILLSSKL